MTYRILADGLVLVHLGFVMFVVLGGLLVRRWPRLGWAHFPAFVWGAGIELLHGVCPLTPLENLLRQRGGQAGYTGGFVEHYVLPALYPDRLTPSIQVGLGVAVLVINGLAYGWWFTARRRRSAQQRMR